MRNFALLVPAHSKLDEFDDVCVELGHFHQYAGMTVKVQIELDAGKDDSNAAQSFGDA